MNKAPLLVKQDFLPILVYAYACWNLWFSHIYMCEIKAHKQLHLLTCATLICCACTMVSRSTKIETENSTVQQSMLIRNMSWIHSAMFIKYLTTTEKICLLIDSLHCLKEKSEVYTVLHCLSWKKRRLRRIREKWMAAIEAFSTTVTAHIHVVLLVSRLELQMRSMVHIWSTLSISMELASHMALSASTSGVLLQWREGLFSINVPLCCWKH